MTFEAGSEFCPYVGLAPFDHRHQDYYFGRELDSVTLADNVLHAPTTVLYGPSGVGKSSLINVGLPAALVRRRSGTRMAVFRRWQDPDAHGALIRCVAEVAGLAVPAGPIPDHRDLHDLLGSVPEGVAGTGPLVIVLDQFEEYFAYRPDQRDERLELALDRIAADDQLGVRILVAIREDRYHLLDGLRVSIPSILDNTLELDHLDDDGVRDAITRPLEVFNARFRAGGTPIPPPGIVERLIAELRQADTGTGKAQAVARRIELPYLQLALEKIWEAAGKASMRSLDDGYPEGSRIGQILADHLDGVMDRLTADQRTLAARVFDRLVTRSGAKFAVSAYDLADTARGLHEDAIQELLSRLSEQEARILIPVARLGSAQSFEIFHDVLGPPMLRWKERFESASAAAEAEAAEKRRLTEEAAAARRAEQAERRRFKKAVYAGMVMAALAIAAGVAGILAVQSNREAEAARSEVERQLADVQAALIWSRFDISSLNTEHVIGALWDLTRADPNVRKALLAQVPQNGAHILKFGAKAAEILRAFGLRHTSGDLEPVIGILISALEGTGDSAQRRALWNVLAALAPYVSWESTDLLLDRVLSTGGSQGKFELASTIGLNLNALVQKASQEWIVRFVSDALMQMEKYTGSKYLYGALADNIQNLMIRLNPEQANIFFDRALNAFQLGTEGEKSWMWRAVLLGTAGNLRDEHAIKVFEQLLMKTRNLGEGINTRYMDEFLAAVAESLPREYMNQVSDRIYSHDGDFSHVGSSSKFPDLLIKFVPILSPEKVVKISDIYLESFERSNGRTVYVKDSNYYAMLKLAAYYPVVGDSFHAKVVDIILKRSYVFRDRLKTVGREAVL